MCGSRCHRHLAGSPSPGGPPAPVGNLERTAKLPDILPLYMLSFSRKDKDIKASITFAVVSLSENFFCAVYSKPWHP